LIDLGGHCAATTAVGGAGIGSKPPFRKFAQGMLFCLKGPSLVTIEFAEVCQQSPHGFCRALVAVRWHRGCAVKLLRPPQWAVER
jgi:hypothetical protein